MMIDTSGFTSGLAPSHICLNGAACNNSVRVGPFLHAGLDSLEQLLDNITSPGKIRKRRALLGEIPQALLFIRSFQQHNDILGIDPVVWTDCEPELPAFFIQLGDLVVFPRSVRSNRKTRRPQKCLQRELNRMHVHEVRRGAQRLVGVIQQVCRSLILPCEPKERYRMRLHSRWFRRLGHPHSRLAMPSPVVSFRGTP